MSNLEDEIVSMQFDNKQFESGVGASLGSIEKLKGALSFSGAGAGLADIQRGVNGFTMNPMHDALLGISKGWLALTTVAVTAISNITNKVVNAGLSLAKGFTLDPITQGFQEYEKNLNSIQTIVANTGKSVPVVNGYLQDLNHYSDQTIYNFGTMADAIGKFTAAGVKVDIATSAIKGMANSAALGGSSVDQLNTAMYQVSQALSTGTIRLMDWNSISTAGLGGTNMQEAFKATAHTVDGAGEAMDSAIASAGNFRDSLQAGWFSAGIFNKTMKVMAGNTLKNGKTVAFTVEQLKGMGYAEDAAIKLNKLSGAAIDSATKVKTFSQLIDVVKESIGSGWSKIFQDIFGEFDEAVKLWTAVSSSITGAVGRVFGAVDKMLVGWRDLGGFKELWNTVGNVFKILGNLIHPVVALFQALLPSTGKAGSSLEKFTSFLEHFTGFLVKLTDPLGEVTFKTGVMGRLFKIVAGTVGAFVSALKPLLPILSDLGDYVGNLFNQGMDIASNLISGWTAGLDPQALKAAAIDLANNWITWIKDALGIHSPASTMVPVGLNIVQGILQGILAGAALLIGGLQKLFTGLGQLLKGVVTNINWSDVVKVINEGLFVAIGLAFYKFINSFTGTIGQFKKLIGSAGGVLDQLSSNLKTMQSKVKSEVIRNIAISVAILAASALLLSTVDGKKLGVALGAIAGLMVSLISAMGIVGKGTNKMSAKQMGKQAAVMLAVSTAMVAFASSILILSTAVALMGQLDPKTIETGLAGVAGVIALITAATAVLGKTGGGATILATATALVVLSAGLTAFVGVMKIYEKLDWKTLVRGGGGAAAIIVGIGLAMRVFGKGAVGGSVGLTIAAVGLRIMAQALTEVSKIGTGALIKTVFALALVISSLAAASLVMSAAEGGAASMLVMSASIIVLAKALQILAAIPGGDLVKAILAMAFALGTLALAAILLAPAVPLIAALGTAVLLIGGAMLLAGVGFLAFATGLGILAVVGPAAFAAMKEGIDQFLPELPKIGKAFGAFFVSILQGFVDAAQPLAKALGKLISILIDVITNQIPHLKHLAQALVNAILDVIGSSAVHAGAVMIRFVLTMLRKLNDGVPKMIRAGANLIIAIITGLSKQGVRIANATGKAILDFLKGFHKAILKYEEPIIKEGLLIARDLIAGMVQGIKDGAGAVGDAAGQLAKDALDKVKHPWEIFSPSHATRRFGQYFSQGAALGIEDHAGKVSDAAQTTGEKAVNALRAAFRSSRASVDDMIDTRPRITPVLDLSQLAQEASRMGSHLGTATIKADVSRNQARDIASHHSGHHKDDHKGGDTFTFEQNNYSPEPINHVKAYRGTRSQIALFKEVVGR